MTIFGEFSEVRTDLKALQLSSFLYEMESYHVYDMLMNNGIFSERGSW